MFQGPPDQAVQFARLHSLPGLFEQHLRVVHQRLHVLSAFARDEGDGYMPHRAEGVSQVVHPLLGWHLVVHQVPFVDHEDAGLVIVRDVFDELLIDFADSL